MPREMASSSSPPVSTVSVRLPMTMAVPVSWHIGSTPPAETQALRSRSVATNRSFGRGLGVVDDRAQLRQVRGPQQVLDVVHGLADERGDRGRVDLQERAARGLDDGAGRQRQTAVPVSSGPSGSSSVWWKPGTGGIYRRSGGRTGPRPVRPPGEGARRTDARSHDSARSRTARQTPAADVGWLHAWIDLGNLRAPCGGSRPDHRSEHVRRQPRAARPAARRVRPLPDGARADQPGSTPPRPPRRPASSPSTRPPTSTCPPTTACSSSTRSLPRPPLATDRVRFVGEAVAVVVGETKAAAVDAVELVEVDYDALPAVADPEAALQDGAPAQFEGRDNLAAGQRSDPAEAEAALADAEVVVRARMVNQRVAVLSHGGQRHRGAARRPRRPRRRADDLGLHPDAARLPRPGRADLRPRRRAGARDRPARRRRLRRQGRGAGRAHRGDRRRARARTAGELGGDPLGEPRLDAARARLRSPTTSWGSPATGGSPACGRASSATRARTRASAAPSPSARPTS